MRLALIGPAFFGYLDRLGARFAERGIPTTVFDERPSNRLVAKLALRLAPAPARARAARHHHRRIVEAILDAGIDHVLLVAAEAFPPSLVVLLRARGVRVCLYSWDSLANKPHVRALARYVDAMASFDAADCARHGLVHVPLYGPGVDTDPDAGAGPGREVDFLFCATMHSGRPRWLNRLRATARAEGWSLDVMAFYHSRSLWLMRNALAPDTWSQLGQIRTRMFAAEEIRTAIARSRVVVDIPHPRQSGLTMRVFEALCGGATVLTSNPAVPAQLPHGLDRRVLVLGGRADTAAQMRRALAIEGAPLPAEARHWLSVDRFVDQILALIRGGAAPGRAGLP